MKALRDLRKFILFKLAEGEHAEVRAYVMHNIDSLAKAFCVPATTIMDCVEGVRDDNAFASRMLETIMRAEHVLRKTRRDSRARSAQTSADVLARTVRWEGERAVLDMPSLLSSALTRRDDLLVFLGADFSVAVSQAHLLDIARIQRARVDLTGYVDRHGLHLRWKTGGLNLLPQRGTSLKADRILFCLPPMPVIVAA